MTTGQDIVQERCFIDAGEGSLEGELSYPQDGQPAFALLIAGPHPYMGGNLENNVVRAWSAETARQGGLALTFNYFAVGQSSGPPIDVPQAMQQFWQTGHAPQDDSLVSNIITIWRYLAGLVDVPILAGGYSFGCWCIAQNLQTIQPAAVILVSPTLGRHDFSSFHHNTIPTCVIAGEKDFVSSEEILARWVQQTQCITTSHRLDNGEHFFRGQEQQVADLALKFIRELLK